MKWSVLALALSMVAGLVGCTSNCDNAGVAVDGEGNIIVLGENGLVSPNSTILRNVESWPTSPPEEESFAQGEAQGYAVAGDGLYLLKNTARHPSLVYRVDLRTGISSMVGGNEPARTRAMGLGDPDFIATDQSGRVYAASVAGVVTQLPASTKRSGTTSVRAFLPPFGRDMQAFAADSAGYLYFSSASNNAVVVIDPRGRVTLLAGPATDLRSPRGLAVGPGGSLYVANAAQREILIFARGSHGNARPIGRIGGPAAMLIEPQALAIGGRRLYVFDGLSVTNGFRASHFVRVFDVGARGNAAPSQSYLVATKCWANAI